MSRIVAAARTVVAARTVGATRPAVAGRTPEAFLNNLVLWLPLEEAGTGIRRDIIFNTPMTNTGGVTQGVGKFGNCGSFVAASSQRLIAPTTFKLMDYGLAAAGAAPANSGVTMMCWVNGTTLPAAQCPFSRDSVGANRSIRLGLGSAHANATFSTTGSDSVTLNGTSTLATGTWYHVCAVLDLSIPLATLYVNGVAETTSAAITTWWVNVGIPIRVGCRDVSSDPFNGLIDDCFIFTRALSAAQVAWIYNAGPGRTYPFLGN